MDLRICRICLRAEARVYKYDRFQLKSYYEEVLALKINDRDGLPHYFCYECATMLHKFHKFKEKCYSGQKVLKEMLWRGPITYEAVFKIDKTDYGLQSSLSISNVNSTVKEYSYKENLQNVDIKPDNDLVDDIGVDLDDAYTDNEYKDPEQDPVDVDRTKMEDEVSELKRTADTNDKIDVKKETEVKKEAIIGGKKRKVKHYNNDGEQTNIKGIILGSNHWKVFNLTEEEAVKAFRERAEDKKYLEAAYKCTDCFKGFSTEMILKRHNKLRHSESIGKFECRFCRVRFKLDCYLKRHIRQHFDRYKCLRCSLVCDLEYTAFLHNEYHSGVAKKCVYCDQEFRHSSTYYSHLRTHRSEFVCALCGASFVSRIGLRQHQRVTHAVENIEIDDDDDEEVNTFCKRCDIRFETRKAYKEHLFHSVMHTEDVTEGMDDEETMPRKVLGKKMQSKITNEMQKSKSNDTQFPPAYKKKQWGRGRRANKKPTTCHQCGKSFDTQMACMKHHVTEHPRTSFFPPTERHICEVCGVSLAPGSVAAHQNMHTKEKIHSCPTCGKQFYASVSYKRHLLTHTGEKPYGCTLCDKRFTQSNSMKLHYRTFHLKEPYPKRNRRKKKTDIKEPEAGNEEVSEDESDDSLTETDQMEPQRRTEPAPNAHVLGNEIHYLTLP